MKHYKIIVVIYISFLFTSCGKNNEKETDTNPPAPQTIVVKNQSKTQPKENSSIEENTTPGSISESEEPAKNNPRLQSTKRPLNKESQITGKVIVLNTSPQKKPEIKYDITFLNFKKLLNKSKIGQTITHEQLINEYHMPEEGVKIVKNIVKVSKNELAFKWQSTWLIEKLSDAEFEDATLKIEFRNNNLHTSGDAIGIKYNNKIYNNLILKNGSAYIPSVKGYHWEIRKQ